MRRSSSITAAWRRFPLTRMVRRRGQKPSFEEGLTIGKERVKMCVLGGLAIFGGKVWFFGGYGIIVGVIGMFREHGADREEVTQNGV